MKQNIVIEKLEGLSIEKELVEIVERKGEGHPDYICDALSEAASQALSKYYLREFGLVLHHNLDKGLLVAGKSIPKFGGGKIVKPIKITIAGRATDKVGKFIVPVAEITQTAVKNCLAQILNLSQKELEKYFKISIDFRPGAANLQEVFRRSKKIALANDTSFGVAHGPLSRTEKLALNVANLINSQNFVKRFPFAGKDIKVMALREKENVLLTIAIAFVDKYIKSVKDYFEKKEKIKKAVENYIDKNFNFKQVQISINVLDDPEAKNEAGIYLTVLGLSAEQGDDGQVGRGNRTCGLITPCREMSMEAAAGKNINHPGKLYQALALIIAQEIGRIKGVEECYVKLLSQIGKPLDQPKMVFIKLRADNFAKTKEKALLITQKTFNNLKELQLSIVEGEYPLF